MLRNSNEVATVKCALGSAVTEDQHRACTETLEAGDLSRKVLAVITPQIQLRRNCSLENQYVPSLSETLTTAEHIFLTTLTY